MEIATDILVKVLSPLFYPVLQNQRIYIPYLLAAMLIAFLVYLARYRRSGANPLIGFWRYCFPRAVYGHRSAILDYKFFFANKAAFALFVAPVIVGSTVVSDYTHSYLVTATGPAESDVAAGWGVTVALTVAITLAFDFGIFFTHYLQHKIPVLWEFHKIHHTAEVLTPMTIYRMHPIDELTSGSVVGVLTGLVHGAFTFAYGDDVSTLTVGSINISLFLFYIAGYNLRHTHIWLPYPRSLSHVLVSPAQHQIHHSLDAKHLDKNMGFIFAFWDYAFGTLYVPREKEDLVYGLYRNEHLEYDSVLRLFFLPVRKAYDVLTRRQRENP